MKYVGMLLSYAPVGSRNLWFLLLFISTSCFAQQVFRWTDQNGLVHFSDQAPMPKIKKGQTPFKPSTSRACLEAQDKLELFKEGLWVSNDRTMTHGALNEQERQEALKQIKDHIRAQCPLAKAVK